MECAIAAKDELKATENDCYLHIFLSRTEFVCKGDFECGSILAFLRCCTVVVDIVSGVRSNVGF